MTNQDADCVDDRRSKVGQFYWDKLAEANLPVLLRKGESRYLSKLLVEVLVFTDISWSRFVQSQSVGIIEPLQSYKPTAAEILLLKHICDFHLAERLNERGAHTIKQFLNDDVLLEYDEFLPFLSKLISLRDSTKPAYVRIQPSSNDIKFRIPLRVEPKHGQIGHESTVKQPSSWIPKQSFTIFSSSRTAKVPVKPISMENATSFLPINQMPDSSVSKNHTGWVQINNVFIPFVQKGNQVVSVHNMQLCILPLTMRIYVPLQILLRCGVITDNMFDGLPTIDSGSIFGLKCHVSAMSIFKSLSMRASKEDANELNRLIRTSKVEADLLYEGCHLVNLHHLLICSPKILYTKYLSIDDPKASVLKRYKEILASIHSNRSSIGFVKLSNPPKTVPCVRANVNDPLVIPIRTCPESLVVKCIEGRHLKVATAAEIDLINMAFVYFAVERHAFKNRFYKSGNSAKSGPVPSPLPKREELVVTLDAINVILTSMRQVEIHQISLFTFQATERNRIYAPLNKYNFDNKDHSNSQSSGTRAKNTTFGEFILNENCGCKRVNGKACFFD
ncbi:hypothetical protein ACOME3_007600 [Neoechinorhynchus agilis]